MMTDKVDVVENKIEFMKFIEAARLGKQSSLTLIKQFLQQNDSVIINGINSSGKTALIVAATVGQLAVVRLLLRDERIRINAIDPQGDMALAWAAYNGHLDVVKILLSKMTLEDISHRNMAGNNAAREAERNHHQDIAILIVEQEQNLKIKNLLQDFIEAAKVGDKNSFERMHAWVQNEIPVLNACDSQGSTALIWAAQLGFSTIVNDLLARPGIVINAANDNGDTALICAARCGFVSIVAALLPKMSLMEIGLKNQSSSTALEVAEQKEYRRIVQLINYRVEQLHAEQAHVQFIEAAKTGDLLSVQTYIKENPIEVINLADKEGNTVLIWAVSVGHVEIVKTLLSIDGLALNIQNNHGNSALHCAVIARQFLSVTLLLAQPTSANLINLKNTLGFTALMYAAHFGKQDIAELLLNQNGIEINAKNNEGDTALGWAAYQGHLEIVALLLPKLTYDEINAPNNLNFTAAQEAQNRGHVNIASLILEKSLSLRKVIALNEFIEVVKRGGMNASRKMRSFVAEDITVINHQDSEGNTALMWAASRGYDDIVLALINKPGIELTARNHRQDTALNGAVREGHKKIVSILLNSMKLKDINLANQSGITAFDEAEQRGSRDLVILFKNRQLIRRSGVALQEFLAAASEGDLFTVQSYLRMEEEGIINCVDSKRNTALILAAFAGHLAMVELLLTIPGISINFSNTMGKTALMNAASGGHLAIVTLLLAQKGIEPGLVDSNCDTALSWAAYEGRTHVTKALLPQMSIPQINCINRFGRTPIQEAQRKGHYAIVVLIIEHLSALKTQFSQWTPQQQLDAKGYKGDVPQDLVCPIAQDDCLMSDPITVSSGMTFDRINLKTWGIQNLSAQNTFPCPLTRKPILVMELNNEPSEFIQMAIERFVIQNTQDLTVEEKTSKEPECLLLKESKEELVTPKKRCYEALSARFFSHIYKAKSHKVTPISPQQQLDALNFNGIVPAYLVCPIAKNNKVMLDPVTISSGKTFERATLITKSKETLNAESQTFLCPKTSKRISLHELQNAPTAAVKRAVHEFVLEQIRQNQGISGLVPR